MEIDEKKPAELTDQELEQAAGGAGEITALRYTCKNSGCGWKKIYKITDDLPLVCPQCGGSLRRQASSFNPSMAL